MKQGVPLAVVVLLVAGLLGSPAPASSARPSVTLRVTQERAAAGDVVEFRGTSTGRLQKIVLQQRLGSRWTVVEKVRKPRRRYSFSVTLPPDRSSHRVNGVRRDGSRVVSRAVTVVAKGTHRTTLPEVREQILSETNAYREDADLPRLTMSAPMNTVASDWSEDMAGRETMDHNPNYADQIPPGWTRAGENVAYGHGHQDVTTAWYDSPGHRENLLGDYTHIGIGYAVSPSGRPYYTQNFGKY